jgi:hypothetical protein
MGGCLSTVGVKNPQALTIIFILPIIFGAALIAYSVFTIEMIKKEYEDKKMEKDKYRFMQAISIFNIVFSVIGICFGLYYGIYFALPKKYKLKIDYYFEDRRSRSKISKSEEVRSASELAALDLKRAERQEYFNKRK